MKLTALLLLVCLASWSTAAPASEEDPSVGDALAAAEAESASPAEAVVAAADAEAATGNSGAVEAAIEEQDPQDNVAQAAESKSKRTVAAMLGYPGYAGNTIAHDGRHYYHPHPQQAYHIHQPQYSQQSQPQYHTLRYYPSKAAAEQVASAPSAVRPHYQIQYTAYVPPPATHSAAQGAHAQTHYSQGGAQQVVQVAPVAAASQPIVAFQQPTHPALFAPQQLIPVIVVRVADPAQHGLATAALLPASALGLGLPHGLPGLGLPGLQGLQGLILQHYMQQAAAAAAAQQPQPQPQAQHTAHAYYTHDPTPPLTQQQLKQLYAQQQAAAAAGGSAEAKKAASASASATPTATPVAAAAPQKPRKGSVTIEPAHNVDNSYTQYKYSNYKDKN